MGPMRASALWAGLSLAVAGDLITGGIERSEAMGDASADLKLSTERGETGEYDKRRELARSDVDEGCREASVGVVGQGDSGFAWDAFLAMIGIERNKGRTTKII